MSIVDSLLEIIDVSIQRPHMLNYNKRYVGLHDGNRSRNFILFIPRKKYVQMRMQINDPTSWLKRCEDAGVDADVVSRGRLRLNITQNTLVEQNEFLGEVIGQCVREYSAS